MNAVQRSRKMLAGATASLTMCVLGASALPVAAAEPAPYMVEDINTSGDSSPSCLTEMGGVLYFGARSVGRGTELWRSDGTALGTRRVKDINPGSGSSSPCNMKVVGGLLYFYARDGVHGHELWVSDGTNAGTRMIKDINPGSASSTPFFFTGANGLVFFSAEDAVAGRELWRTDGTNAGTQRVRDLSPGTAWSEVYPLGGYGGKLYFSYSPWNGPDEGVLYRTDGTRNGTKPFRDKNGKLVRGVYSMAELGSTMLFSGQLGTWRSLGTPATTNKIASVGALDFIPFNGALYFSAPSGELWRTNGTKAGTVRIVRIRDDWGDVAFIDSNLVNLGSQLFFFANHRPWVSDGTTGGTQPVGSDLNNDENIVALNGVAYFDSWGGESFEDCYDGAADRPSTTPAPGTLLWSSDGTLGGTTNVDCRWAYIWELTVVGNSIFYASDADLHGSELWRFVP
jgi:ELWxxDGT repeat protein